MKDTIKILSCVWTLPLDYRTSRQELGIHMNYARINTLTFSSEDSGDTIQAQYTETAPTEFSEASLLTFVRTGPLTASLTSIYPDKEAFDRSAPIRKERMKANKALISGVYVSEGTAALFHVKA